MIFAALAMSLVAAASAMPLDDYVWAPDSNYGWVDLGEAYLLKGCSYILEQKQCWTGYTLNMTSQRWLTDDDFSANSESGSIWWHMLVVIVPDNVRFTRNASMWITGGGMGGVPKAEDEDILLSAALAVGTGTITGALFQIPNEHTTFSSDPIQKSRTEDAIIAFTWDHFLKDTSRPEWLVRFPMVKASVRAMDAITEFVAMKFPQYQLDYYVVAGASKRGWTTWLVGAVDPNRVMGIVPIVLDAINFVAVEHHQWMSYNGWSWALQDYLDMDIMTRLDTPEMLELQRQEDPFFFKERLTMPKLVVNAFLDEFQQPDDTRYWWNEMPEPKHFIMTPNAEHSEITGILEIVPAIGTWTAYLLNRWTIPTFTWTISETTGEITAILDGQGTVASAHVYWGYSCGNNANAHVGYTKRRDFRILNVDSPCKCGPSADGYCTNLRSFESSAELTASVEDGKRVYRAKVDAPSDGRYVAFFIDVKYLEHGASSAISAPQSHGFIPTDKPGQLEFTTEVSVWPNTFPYPDCTGATCGGKVV